MKKISLVIAVFLLASIAGCKSDSDVLATYKGGDIKRGDFNKWLEAKRLKQDSLMKSKKKQIDKLEQMMLEKITIMKAREEGFDKTKDYLALEEMATEGQLMKRLYDREVRDKATFSEEAVKMSQIFLRVKDYTIDNTKKNKKIMLSKADLEKEVKATMEKAADIIKKLEGGESFAELAKKHSEDFSKRKGGDMGFVVKDMVTPELTDIVFSMKPGEYTREPVKTDKGVYIVKVEEKKTLTEKNIDDIITDKGQAMRFKNGMLRKYAETYIDGLMSAKDVAYYEDKALSKNQQAVLFKIGDKSYTVGDFNNRMELKNKGMSKNMPKMPEITGERKKGLAKNYFKYEILKRNALEKGIDKDPEYIKEADVYKESILSREYSNKIFESDVTVSNQEMLDEYNQNKDKRYYKMEKKGKNKVKKIESFASAKERIERNLLSKKKAEKRKQWKDDIIKEYQFKVDESELEGD